MVQTSITKEIDWHNFKARCSSISAVKAENRASKKLTDKQLEELKKLEAKEELSEAGKRDLAYLQLKLEKSKEVLLSDTYTAYLIEEYAWIKDKMLSVNKDLDTHQLQKGRLVEPEAVELLSLVENVKFNYNILKERVCNDFLSGEVDCWEGKSIMEANIIADTKARWDYIGYLVKTEQPIDPCNRDQVQGYMLITGAKTGLIADCLIDTPDIIKMDVMQSLLRKGIKKGLYISEESEDFKFDWAMYDRSMTFSDKFTPQQRFHKKPVEPINELDKQFLYDQVKRGRDFLYKLHEKRTKLR